MKKKMQLMELGKKHHKKILFATAALLLVLLPYIAKNAASFSFNSDQSSVLVDSNKVGFSLVQGEIRQYPLKFSNARSIKAYISIAIEAVKSFITPNKSSLEIGPRQAQEISLIVAAPSNQAPNLYDGKIFVRELRKGGDNSITGKAAIGDQYNILKVIDSAISVSTKNGLFAVNLAPQRIAAGKLLVRVDIANKGAPLPASGFLEIYSKRIGGDIIDSRLSRISLADSITLFEELNASEDRALVFSKLRHNGEVIVSGAFYDAGSEQQKPSQDYWKIIYISAGIIFAIAVVVFFWIFIKRSNKKIKGRFEGKAQYLGAKEEAQKKEGEPEISSLKKRLMSFKMPKKAFVGKKKRIRKL